MLQAGGPSLNFILWVRSGAPECIRTGPWAWPAEPGGGADPVRRWARGPEWLFCPAVCTRLWQNQ